MESGIKVPPIPRRCHLHILLWNDSGVQRLQVEITRPDSADENDIETFYVA
jgi:hypothetical protein